MGLKVVAGDFATYAANGYGAVGFVLWPNDGKFRWSAEVIPMSQVEILEQASEASVKKIGGTVGWGLAGAAVLGPVGLLAGLLMGGKKTEITFVTKFKDGRKLIATVDPKTWARILSARL
jgi:hypothetical protein